MRFALQPLKGIAMLLNVAVKLLPTALYAPITATLIRATMSPYSIAVAPASSLSNLFSTDDNGNSSIICRATEKVEGRVGRAGETEIRPGRLSEEPSALAATWNIVV